MTKSKLIQLGRITTPHGLRGQVKIISYTEYPKDIINYGSLFDSTGKREFIITKLSAGAKGTLTAKIEDITSREKAEELKNIGLYAERSKVPAPKDEESFLIEDLVGLKVEQQNNSHYGNVHAVHNFGAGDLIEIKLHNSKDTEFYNFTKENFPTINIANNLLTFSPPEKTQVIAEDAKEE